MPRANHSTTAAPFQSFHRYALFQPFQSFSGFKKKCTSTLRKFEKRHLPGNLIYLNVSVRTHWKGKCSPVSRRRSIANHGHDHLSRARTRFSGHDHGFLPGTSTLVFRHTQGSFHESRPRPFADHEHGTSPPTITYHEHEYFRSRPRFPLSSLPRIQYTKPILADLDPTSTQSTAPPRQSHFSRKVS